MYSIVATQGQMLNLPGAKEDYTEDSVLEEREKSSLGKAKGKRPSKEREQCVQSGGGLIVLGSALSSV